jgi:hypothetical protein
MTTHPDPTAGTSQCDLILAALLMQPGQWLPMTYLGRVAGCWAVHSRISDLRRRGHVIDQRNERAGRKILSSYRINAA